MSFIKIKNPHLRFKKIVKYRQTLILKYFTNYLTRITFSQLDQYIKIRKHNTYNDSIFTQHKDFWNNYNIFIKHKFDGFKYNLFNKSKDQLEFKN